jgi:hypothetical protein
MVPVEFNEDAIAEDLTYHPSVARRALDLFRREVDRDGGLSFSRLKRCDEEGRDGTRLAGCVKTYVPWPTGRFGLVLLPVAHSTKPLACELSPTVSATPRRTNRASTKSPINGTTLQRLTTSNRLDRLTALRPKPRPAGDANIALVRSTCPGPAGGPGFTRRT